MLEIGSLIDGKYKILNEVGHGGMSVVYLAMNEKANKQWAIKEVRKDGVKDFEVVKQSLVAETNMLKKLSHPSLPDIVDVIDDHPGQGSGRGPGTRRLLPGQPAPGRPEQRR